MPLLKGNKRDGPIGMNWPGCAFIYKFDGTRKYLFPDETDNEKVNPWEIKEFILTADHALQTFKDDQCKTGLLQIQGVPIKNYYTSWYQEAKDRFPGGNIPIENLRMFTYN